MNCCLSTKRQHASHEKSDQRIEIWFMLREGLSQNDIHRRLVNVHGAAALSKSSVQRWVKRIQIDGADIQDRPKTGRKQICDAVQPQVRAILDQEKRSTIHQIAEQTQVSIGTTHKIITKDMKLKKKPAKWVPHLLTTAQKLHRLTTSRIALAMMQSTHQCPGLHRVVAQDESWFHTWDPESKQASRQWLADGEAHPEKVRREISVTKSMMVVFFDSDGVIY